MAEVNENLARDNAKCMFVTLFIGVLDLDTGELLYANGGHNPRFGSATTAWHGSKASAGLWSARWKA
ncbi:MAG: SpoIIE family protein phosphatase [Bilophila wadsworthia]